MFRSIALRQWIISTHLLKPDLSPADMTKELIAMKQYRKNQYDSAYHFVCRTIERGSVEFKKRHRPHPVTSKENISIVRNRFNRIKGTTKCSVREIKKYVNSKDIPMSYGSTHTIIDEHLNKKSIAIRKTQKLTQEHKDNRVVCAKYLIRKYGKTPRWSNYAWDRVLITDMSKPFRLNRPKNPQNDKVWVPKDYDPTTDLSMLKITTKGTNKSSPGVILWGGVVGQTLIPKKGPFFFSDWLKDHCKKIGKKKCTLDNEIYAYFIENVVCDIIRRELPHEPEYYIFEDDNDTKYRTPYVREQLSRIFPNRIPPNRIASKMADVWSIENVWGDLGEACRMKDFDNLEQLKKYLSYLWRQIRPETIKKMVLSLPYRLQAVIDKEGEEITKKDYKHSIPTSLFNYC